MESDDDEAGCCHWSKTKEFDSTSIEAHSASPEYGKPSIDIDVDSSPHDLVELVVDNDFIDVSIDGTNEHAANDRSFQDHIGKIEKNDRGRALVRGFLVVK